MGSARWAPRAREPIEQTAARELVEETGARKFSLVPFVIIRFKMMEMNQPLAGILRAGRITG
jgi:8-oxo-dGTP pyrophosphatase MutT (NUDIX family)